MYSFQAFGDAGCAAGSNVTQVIEVIPGGCYPDPSSPTSQRSASWAFVNATASRVFAYLNRNCSGVVALQFDVLNCVCTLNSLFLPVPFKFTPVQGDASCGCTTYGQSCTSNAECCGATQCLRHASNCNGTFSATFRCATAGAVIAP